MTEKEIDLDEFFEEDNYTCEICGKEYHTSHGVKLCKLRHKRQEDVQACKHSRWGYTLRNGYIIKYCLKCNKKNPWEYDVMDGYYNGDTYETSSFSFSGLDWPHIKITPSLSVLNEKNQKKAYNYIMKLWREEKK